MASPLVLERTAPSGTAARDLTVDLLRAVAMVLVVTGHWLVVVPRYDDGAFGGINALESVPLMRGLSWIFQVMPLFFAIGGYAGAASWARARGYPRWLRTRLDRLLRPTLALFVTWAGLCALARLAWVDPALVRDIGNLVVVPVWFLAVYAVATALVPVSVAAHRRFGLAAPMALAAMAVAVDAVRILTPFRGVAVVNFVAVYLFAQQLGLWWYEGRVPRPGWLALAGLAGLVVLTTVGPYPMSMVGVPGEDLANNAPPTVCLVALALVQVGLAVKARPVLARLLTRRPVQIAALALNRNAMTILLWHFTALVIGAVVMLPLGVLPDHPAGSAAWWAVRFASVAALTPVLVLVAAVAGRTERAARPPTTERLRPPTVATVRLLIAVVLLSAGFATVAVRGLSELGTPLGLPLLAMALVGGGAALTRP
jgi:fucose 4-O-acetylase-like acetyltransferase